jgi:hypothetical protein
MPIAAFGGDAFEPHCTSVLEKCVAVRRILQAAIRETTPMICACGAGQLSSGQRSLG